MASQAIALSQRWNAAGTLYSAVPTGDVLATAQRLFGLYGIFVFNFMYPDADGAQRTPLQRVTSTFASMQTLQVLFVASSLTVGSARKLLLLA